MIDYNAYQPHVAQFNVTVEQRLPGNMALTVAYAGSRGAHLWTEKEGNPVLPTYVSPAGPLLVLRHSGLCQRVSVLPREPEFRRDTV